MVEYIKLTAVWDRSDTVAECFANWTAGSGDAAHYLQADGQSLSSNNQKKSRALAASTDYVDARMKRYEGSKNKFTKSNSKRSS